MKKTVLALILITLASALGSCAVETVSYEPGYTYSTYTVGYDNAPAYDNWGDGYYPAYRHYYDSDFYVRDNVMVGPGFRRGEWRSY